MAHDVIICESEFIEEGSKAGELAQSAEDAIVELMTLLNRISSEGIQKGNVADNFCKYVEMIANLQGKLGSLMALYETTINRFISEVTDADNYDYFSL